MNAWQKCPVCDGSGVIYRIISTQIGDRCPTCEGKRIISVLDGKPPAEPKETP